MNKHRNGKRQHNQWTEDHREHQSESKGPPVPGICICKIWIQHRVDAVAGEERAHGLKRDVEVCRQHKPLKQNSYQAHWATPDNLIPPPQEAGEMGGQEGERDWRARGREKHTNRGVGDLVSNGIGGGKFGCGTSVGHRNGIETAMAQLAEGPNSYRSLRWHSLCRGHTQPVMRVKLISGPYFNHSLTHQETDVTTGCRQMQQYLPTALPISASLQNQNSPTN